jgi:23S rRNA (guanosine2251-2'-O)-methyltransferase
VVIRHKPPHRDIQKTALGATETVRWQHFETTIDAINALKRENYCIVSIEQAHQSTWLHTFQPETNRKFAFVFGNEVHGVHDEVIQASDMVLEIPQLGAKHSLNIAVSVGIVVWQFTQRFLPSLT